VLVFRCLHDTAPPNLASELRRVADVDSRKRLRSSSTSALCHTIFVSYENCRYRIKTVDRFGPGKWVYPATYTCIVLRHSNIRQMAPPAIHADKGACSNLIAYRFVICIQLDSTLSCREHLTKTAGKLKNRNNLMKLAGSTWGASANTLRSAALTLCYSAAEYCAPVWSRSAHTSQADVQLNSTMRLISGTLRSTPLPWLPVLSNIEPPALRRKATDKLVEKIVKHDCWPIQPDILSPPLLRLTSRIKPYVVARFATS